MSPLRQNPHLRPINLVWPFHLYEAVSEGIWSAGVPAGTGIEVRFHHNKQETPKKFVSVRVFSLLKKIVFLENVVYMVL